MATSPYRPTPSNITGDLQVPNYIKSPRPVIQDSIPTYIDDELEKIKVTLDHLVLASPQVATSEPERKIKSMIRYAKLPWDPLSDGSEGFVYWDGAAWSAL